MKSEPFEARDFKHAQDLIDEEQAGNYEGSSEDQEEADTIDQVNIVRISE
jgi:hypothetical protein